MGDKLTYDSIRQLSAKFRWSERATAWDRHMDEKDLENLREIRRKTIEHQLAIANALLIKAATALQKTPPEELNPRAIATWIKLATDMQAKAIGDPIQTISLTGPGGGPIQTEDLTGLSDDERRTRLRDLAIEVAHRAGLATVETNTEE